VPEEFTFVRRVSGLFSAERCFSAEFANDFREKIPRKMIFSGKIVAKIDPSECNVVFRLLSTE
jgi:hypothetical protein